MSAEEMDVEVLSAYIDESGNSAWLFGTYRRVQSTAAGVRYWSPSEYASGFIEVAAALLFDGLDEPNMAGISHLNAWNCCEVAKDVQCDVRRCAPTCPFK